MLPTLPTAMNGPAAACVATHTTHSNEQPSCIHATQQNHEASCVLHACVMCVACLFLTIQDTATHETRHTHTCKELGVPKALLQEGRQRPHEQRLVLKELRGDLIVLCVAREVGPGNVGVGG